MKKLILSILLFTVINCSGQYSLKGFTRTCGKDSVFCLLTTAGVLKLPPYDVTKDTLGVRPIIDNKANPSFYSINKDTTSILQVKIYKPSFRIDSTYLQLIIQELERHGYELPKIKKHQPIEYEWETFNTHAPSVRKTNKGDFIIKTDSLTAIKQLWNEIERREKEHEQITNNLYKLLKTNK